VALFCVAAPCAALGGGGNLLRNGGFEETVAPWSGGIGAKAEALRVSGADAASGQGCLRLSCAGQVVALDYPELTLGRELSRLGTYRLSAMVRNDGVRAGNFGLRLICRDAAGEVLAMLGGIGIEADAPVQGWRRRETTFGRGTATPIPPGTVTLTVRFSFWAEDQEPVGCVWLDDVELEALAKAPPLTVGATRLALLWDDAALAPVAGATPPGLEGVLAAAGFTVRRVTSDDLTRPDGLERSAAAAVVLPYGAWYPGPLAAALTSFLAEGGLLVTLGAGALSRPLYASPDGWLPVDAALPGGTPLSLSFAAGWGVAEAAPGDRWDLEPAAQGRVGVFRTAGLGKYAYVGTTLVALPAAADLILSFAARGDPETPRLCLELREQDGSRWKAVIPLGTAWAEYRLHAGQFVAYANDKLGRAESVMRPRQLAHLLVGLTAAMAGPGPHRFELREVRLEPAAVSTAAVAGTPVFAGAEREVARWFGSAARLPARGPAMTCFAPAAESWEAARLRGPAGVAGMPSEPLLGRFAGKAVGVPEAVAMTALSPSLDLAAMLRAGSVLERLPVLRTERRWFAEDEDAAALFLYRDGLLAGSRWLCVGLELPASAMPPALGAALAASLRLAQSAVLSDGIRPRFRERAGHIVMDVVLLARHAGAETIEVPLRVQVTRAGQTQVDRQVTASLPAAAGAATECLLVAGLPMDGSEWLELDIRAAPSAGAPPVIGPLRFRLHAREALRLIAEQLLSAAADDGKLHGYSFIDNRGMRVLLAASEILGRKPYRQTARRWGEAMRREQRADGGYRMGYGITSKGEACYVADGGEVAVGIARLAAYSGSRERLALLRSLDAYARYREEFRVPEGGIGVGWCLQDYGRRPIVPLDVPRRIYAPELNTYTIGCSLAAAYLHATLLGTGSLEVQAAADADWFMSRTAALHGAAIESFQYAHALATDPTQRAVYGDYMGRAFTAKMKEAGAASRSWWLSSGGRSALDLGGMAYVLARLNDDPALRAEMMRATCLMFSPDSPESVLAALRLPELGHDAWIYICYGTLGLVDVIRPLISMDGPQRSSPLPGAARPASQAPQRRS
jgi:hypothetical protein